MANRQSRIMQQGDLERAVRSVARLFDSDEIVVIGSQALLVVHDDVPRELRMSEEFDAYTADYVDWERSNPGEEASEVINAMLGEGSTFHRTHGFFVDGVDATTAQLVPEWRNRAVSRVIEVDGRRVTVVAPEPNDLVAAKLTRGDPKDISFARICLRQGMVKHDMIRDRLEVLLTGERLRISLQRLANATRGSRTPGAETGRDPS